MKKQWVTKLDWNKYNITELDSYADYHFDNGISVRVSTGAMAHTTKTFPYEIHIAHPIKGRSSIPKVNAKGLENILTDMDNEQILSTDEILQNIKNLMLKTVMSAKQAKDLGRYRRLIHKQK